MNEAPRTYRSYLLRLRWVDNAGQPAWRISLQETGNEGEIQFVSLVEMCAYLTGEIEVGEHKKVIAIDNQLQNG